MPAIRTELLDIAFEEGGPSDGRPLLLLHGWPDAACGWDPVSRSMHAHDRRTYAPYLRGFAPTQFRAAGTPRDGSPIAHARDVIEFVDALGLDRFELIGHDWGARIAYALAAICPERISRMVAIGTAFPPHGKPTVPGFDQARLYWYQWFMCTGGGARAVRADPIGFARKQWDTWSPPGWFDDAEFERTARSFAHADWVDVTLNSYRSRWLPDEPRDPRYDALRDLVAARDVITVPTLLLHGGADTCFSPSGTAGDERYFTGGYRRVVLDGVGHFPHREAPACVAAEALAHFENATPPVAS